MQLGRDPVPQPGRGIAAGEGEGGCGFAVIGDLGRAGQAGRQVILHPFTFQVVDRVEGVDPEEGADLIVL